jgi:DNA-binding response OmpR family regulator
VSPLPAVERAAKLVVCDDDAATLELLCDHLTADRFEVLPAPSASDALRLCQYNHPDLLLLDLVLPDAAGLDVLREIRDCDGVSARFDPDLPVIVLSGRSSDADRVRGLTEGADAYLVKPFHYPELQGPFSSQRFQVVSEVSEREASPATANRGLISCADGRWLRSKSADAEMAQGLIALCASFVFAGAALGG